VSNPTDEFAAQCAAEIDAQGKDHALTALTNDWIGAANAGKYSYHFTSLGRPIIQYPQDIVAVQELIWSVKPDLIVETGIAHGGSLILSASMLALIDLCEATQAAATLDTSTPKRKVIGVDIDIREHNRIAIEAHPLSNRIELLQGSSTDSGVVATITDRAKKAGRVMVFLDSNHTHEHVLAELRAYAPLVSEGSYCVVFDTIIEHLPASAFPNRPWGKGNNPMTAVNAYLAEDPRFAIDAAIDAKLLISVAPRGYLKRTNR
jgi:cephalosporin hydroxylase